MINILLVDKTARRQVITKAFIDAIMANFNTLLPNLYKYKSGDFWKYDFLRDNWSSVYPLPEHISLRIRHGSDAFDGMPKADKQVYYGGYFGGVITQETSEYGFEYGVPFTVPNKDDQEIFTSVWANQLIDWVQDNNKFPEFLTKWSFDPIIEKTLKEDLSTFNHMDFLYESIGQDRAIEIAPFQPKILHLFPSTSITEKLDKEINKLANQIEENDKLDKIINNDESDILKKELNNKKFRQEQEILGAKSYDFSQSISHGLNLRFHFTLPLNVLIIWPGDISSSKVLSKLSGLIFDEPHEPFNTMAKVVTTEKDLNSLIDLSEYDLVILPAELRWGDNQHLTDLYGINVAGQLRLRNFAGIIVLPSIAPSYISYHLQKETIKKQDEADHKGRNQDMEVLNMGFVYIWDISRNADGGNSLLPIDMREVAELAWNNLQKDQKAEIETLIDNSYGHRMSPGRLADVIFSLLPEGKLSAIIHEFRRVVQTADQIDLIINAAKNALDKIEYIVESYNIIEFKKLAQEILEEVKRQDGNLEAARGVLSFYRERLASFLPPGESKSELEQNTVKKEPEWGVLLLEDDEDAAGQVQELLKRHQIPTWHTRNAIDAIELLTKDYAGKLPRPPECYAANFIRLVLADIRLQNLTKESSRWDIIQGYEFVDKLHNTMPNFVTPIILTQQEQRILRRSSAINPVWFPKSILRGDGNQELFVEKILELGNEMNNFSIPNNSLWKKGYPAVNYRPFSVYYKQYRLNTQYHDNEEWVKKIASLFFFIWEQGEKGYKIDTKTRRSISELKRYTHKEITYGITKAVEDMKDDKLINLFRAKLAARRAALTISSYIINKSEDSSNYKKLGDLKKRKEDLKKEKEEIEERNRRKAIENKISAIERNIQSIEKPLNDISDEYLKQVCHLIKEKEYIDTSSIDRVAEIMKAQKEGKIKSSKLTWKIKKWKKDNPKQEIPVEKVDNLREEIERDFVSSEFSLIDQILLNRHLGLDNELYYWGRPDNLLIEEQQWLKQLEKSEWNVDNYLG